MDAIDAYIDSEILGYGDILLLPYVSTFTRLSRALMMKRKKIICHSVKNGHSTIDPKNKIAEWHCKNFKTQQEFHYKLPCCMNQLP